MEHHDRGDAVISVPSVLGGGDVVAMLSGTFADHAALTAVTFPTNLYFAEDGALPRGTEPMPRPGRPPIAMLLKTCPNWIS